jgi:hypothetical protein
MLNLPDASAARGACWEHLAHFYTDSDSLLHHLTNYVLPGLQGGDGAIIIAMQNHIDGLQQRLRIEGVDVLSLVERGQLVCVDAQEVLDQIMCGDQPDRHAFNAIVGQLVRHTKSRFSRLLAYGELVNLLWQQNNHAAAHTLEHWWNLLIQQHGFSLMCGYRANVLSYSDGMVDRLHEVCQTHTHVAACDDGERMEAAVNAALSQVLPGSDVEGLRNVLTNRTRPGLHISPAHAVLLGLHSLVPSLAQDVRMVARDHFQREDMVSGEDSRLVSRE